MYTASHASLFWADDIHSKCFIFNNTTYIYTIEKSSIKSLTRKYDAPDVKGGGVLEILVLATCAARCRLYFIFHLNSRPDPEVPFPTFPAVWRDSGLHHIATCPATACHRHLCNKSFTASPYRHIMIRAACRVVLRCDAM